MPEGVRDVKEAVRIAIRYLQEFNEFIPAQGIRLEETEYDDAGFWLITLSTIDIENAFPPVDETMRRVLAFEKGKRIYRVFRIEARTGQVKSMKVRILEPLD